jgi:predicted nucleotidyltransferase
VPNLAAAWIYGSEASGEAGPDSDVDVLVALDAERVSFDDRASVAGATMEVGALLGREVNAVIMTRRELSQRLSLAHPFATRILRARRIAVLGDDTVLGGRPARTMVRRRRARRTGSVAAGGGTRR